MPTYDVEGLFPSDFKRLSPHECATFRAVVKQRVADLRANRPFRPGLRIKSVQGKAGVFEMTWDMADGRATFRFGPEQIPGERHIIWRRVGGHDIFKNP